MYIACTQTVILFVHVHSFGWLYSYIFAKFVGGYYASDACFCEC